MEITNKMLVEYFKRDEVMDHCCPTLKKYLDNRKGKPFKPDNKNKDYLWLANLFMSVPALDETNPDICFYNALKKGGLNGREFKPEALKGLSDDFDKCLCSIKAKPWDKEGSKQFNIEELITLEKWHFFVSWYALEEFYAWDKTKGFEKKWLCNEKYEYGSATARNTGILCSPKCKELLLWMCEVSAGSEAAEKFLATVMDNWASKIRSAILEAVSDYWLEKTGEGL